MPTTGIEIRVHGVAGTSPETMLDLRAELRRPRPDDCARPPESPVQVGVYARPFYNQLDCPVEAFSWGGLTSGRPSTARWLLLLPFVLLNGAGWAMLPQKASNAHDDVRGFRTRVHIAVVRVAGLMLTGVAAGLVALIVADLGIGQILHSELDWFDNEGKRQASRAIAIGLCGVLMVGLWHWTRLRRRDGAPGPWRPASDPAGYGRLEKDQKVMWDHPGAISRMRSLHLGYALGVLGLIASLAPVWQPGDFMSLGRGGWEGALASTALGVPVLWVVAMSFGPGTRGNDKEVGLLGRAVAPILGAAAMIVGTIRLGGWIPPDRVTTLPVLRGSLIALCVVLVVLAVLLWIDQWFLRFSVDKGLRLPFRTTFTAPSLVLLSTGLLAASGTSVALVLAQMVGGDACESDPTSTTCKFFVGDSLDWVAIAFTMALIILIVVAGFALVIAPGETPMERVKAVVGHPSRIFAWVFGIGSVIAVLLIGTVWAEIPYLPPAPEIFEWLADHRDVVADRIATAAGILFAVSLVLAGRLMFRFWGLLAAAAVIALIVWAILNQKQFSVLGVPLPPTSGIQAVVAVGLLLPLAAVATRLLAGMRDHDVRRGIGVLWDLGMFWPRWFHPFTPPTYSDRAVTELARKIDQYQHGDAEAADGERNKYDLVIVSAHSQGSILATVALLLHSQEKEASTLPHVALLTHGSPWGRLYSELFPAMFSTSALMNIAALLGNGTLGGSSENIRWRNLQRKSDPIGGPIVASDQPWLSVDPGGFRGLERDTESSEVPDEGGSKDSCGRIHSGYILEPRYPHIVGELWIMANPSLSDGAQSE